MCGIAGFFDPSAGSYDREAVARSMAGAIRHRGPDDEGVWTGDSGEVVFGHRRLSVIDLSVAGHQPMVSGNGRYVIAYNGEVYNFAELRHELEATGIAFKSDSDTEVVLEACAAWGVEAAAAKFNGMFAFALWDRSVRTLTLTLDRFGIKPLYWSERGDTFLFGSELKALAVHPSFEREIDRDTLAGYLRFGYVPGTHAIYEGVRKLEPGSVMTWRLGEDVQVSRYWRVRDVASEAVANPATVGEGQAIEGLDRVLRDAVKSRMISDVPMGAFLSGGIDSSTIAALMQAQSNNPIRTFSIGFNEAAYDESVYAREVAKHLGTDHTELVVSQKEALEAIPRLPELYDEPFADSSQIPTYLVSKLAREHVTVALSGDGGDELFGGYNRHVLAGRIKGAFDVLPYAVRKAMGASALGLPRAVWGTPRRGDQMAKLATLFGKRTLDEAYLSLASVWNAAPSVVLNASGDAAGLSTPWPDFGTFAEKMMVMDAEMYMPGDILTKVDRASMGVSLEARVPFLDYRVAEYAWQLPSSMKVKGGQGKWILRQVLDRYVPRNLVERPKMGFAVPIDDWLRGDLRDWAEDLLNQDRLTREGYFDAAAVRKKWSEHLSGRRNWQHQLWGLLMFQAWHKS